MDAKIDQLERQLDSFEPVARREALLELVALARDGKIQLPPLSDRHNLHCHTFFSYNACGWSPAKFAWLARKAGLGLAGIVDFDVLDGVEEFLEAARLVGIKAVASLESRVFVPEFKTRVINSPGEPGIAYHMGAGFWRAVEHPFLVQMRAAAAQRTREMLRRVNTVMAPVEVDWERDVLPLTPKGNATERHLCEAFERKAREMFPDPRRRAEFWRQKLGDAPPEGAGLQNLVRARTMKKGGVGYVLPDPKSFPLMAEMNRCMLDCGAIPTVTWLDGTSEGEQCMEELLDVAQSTGAAALNIIPDRNYTPGVKDRKLQNLYDVVALAEKRHLPVIVGTEMNSPGNKFVDDFDSEELKPLLPVFLKGAHIFFAHTLFQRFAGKGYLSEWAAKRFSTVAAKNAFYEAAGRELPPDATAEQVLKRIQQ
ncbi:MAG: hypothetical protein N3B01_09650 [Verrucomicrobiae bacterium]|nr:hypothetical protein [Verrucomicrobiae bacterium]